MKIREVVWIIVALICCAQLARSESPFLDSSGKPLSKTSDSSGRPILAREVKNGCPCGCSGDSCECSNCPRDKSLYATARKVAVDQKRPLVVWVGFTDSKAEAEMKGAIHLHVGYFDGSRTKRVIASYYLNGELWYTDDSVFEHGASVSRLKAAITPPAPVAPVRYVQPSYQPNTIIGGSAGIRGAAC